MAVRWAWSGVDTDERCEAGKRAPEPSCWLVQFKCVATLTPPSVLPDLFEDPECC
jgi:hypothetical protein